MFLANENFPKPAVIMLRNHGYSVKAIAEDSPGISDEEVMKMASALDYIILTFDKDYGELIFRHSKENPPGVIFFREKGANPNFSGELLISLLSESSIQFRNAFIVIETNNIRQRFYLTN